MDAIVIACASRNHINYLNNESAAGKGTKEQKEKLRYDLKAKLCFKKFNDDTKQHYKWVFFKPWESFTQEVKDVLESMVVSFKQNLRVINKTTNSYQRWEKNASGEMVKTFDKQTKGESWAIRKSMHKDTVAGLVKLKFKKTVSFSVALDNWQMIVNKTLRDDIGKLVKEGLDKKKLQKHFKEQNNSWQGLDISKVEIYYYDVDSIGRPNNVASRVAIDESFTSDRIKSITDTGIQKIMLKHLEKYNELKNGKITEHPEIAFSPDGIDEMNKNLQQLNEGKLHQPIYKVRTYEPLGNKFPVGEMGNKKTKYVEAAKGTNLFFAVYADENGKRNYDTIPLNIVIERQKQGLSPVPEVNGNGSKLLFYLSPNDLVYVPSKEEQAEKQNLITSLSKEQVKRLYKIVSFTGNRLYAVPHTVAKSIVDKAEFTQLNKLEFSLDQQSIKDCCIKLSFDRLGNLKTKLSLFDEPGENFGSIPQPTEPDKPVIF